MTFLQSHLKNWLHVFRPKRPLPQPTQKLVEDCGTETIFNLDILRQTQDAPRENALFSQLKNLSSKNNTLVLSSLSSLFSHFARAVKTYQGALFGQGSKHSPITMVEKFRGMCMNFFMSAQDLLEGTEGFAWASQADLLRVVRHDNLFIDSQTAAKAVLASIVEAAIQTLGPGASGKLTITWPRLCLIVLQTQKPLPCFSVSPNWCKPTTTWCSPLFQGYFLVCFM